MSLINYEYIEYMNNQYTNINNKKIQLNLFKEAMTHYTASNKISYDRFEFFGDPIFHLIITEYIYNRYPEENEGFLTKLRIRIECGESMTELAYNICLDQFIQIYNMPLTDKILEDVFEAFIGAYYLNFGMDHTKELVINLIEQYKDIASMIEYDDNFKDILLRYFHQMQWGFPIYHEKRINNKYISIVKDINDDIIGIGKAYSKIKAEQLASKHALMKLEVIKNGEVDDKWIEKIDKKKKEKVLKKTIPIYNPKNIIITAKIINNMLNQYNVTINKKKKINIKTFHEATTHQSYVIRDTKLIDHGEIKSVPLQKNANGRLRFLGGSVIHFVITELIFKKYENENEGYLTKLRSKLENIDSLFILSKRTDIAKYILVSQNIEILHGRNNINILGAGFQAFIGALYIELGFNIAKAFILEIIEIELDIDEIVSNETNYKNIVSEIFIKNGWNHPQYKIINQSGPDHNKIFIMGLYHETKLLSTGTASTKKKATQIASKDAYDNGLKKYF